MSYILEALRKAQAERERGQVPGLEARSLAEDRSASVPAARGLAAGLWAGAVLLLLLGLAVWWWRWAAPPPAVVVASPIAVPVAVPAAIASAAPPAPAPALPMVVSAPPAAAVAASAQGAAASVATAPLTAPASAAPAVLRLAQLPAEQRRQLPPLQVGGSMWSENVTSRFVIIDGQVLREGDVVAPGLLLERLAAKSAWLRWRDLRIELIF